MRSHILTSILAALAVAAHAKPLSSSWPRSSRRVIHEEIPSIQSTWEKAHRLLDTSTLPVRIGLTQQNLYKAEDFIYNVSHPDSPNFGRHWSPEEIVEMFKPRKESVNAVMEWLEFEGIHPSRIKMSASKSWLTFNASVREVEQMLKTEYHIYKHATTEGALHVACDKYHIPEHLVEHVDIITPTVHFDQRIGHDRKNKYKEIPEETMQELRKRSAEVAKRQEPVTGIVGGPSDQSNPKKGSSIDNAMMNLEQCDTMITPDCLRALYSMPRGKSASRNNTLGIVDYTPQAFLQSDLNLYFQEFQPQMTASSPIVKLLDNAIVQTQNQSFNFNGESALDLEFAMALVYPQQTTLFQVGDTVQGASFNNFLDSIDGSYCNFQGGDSTDRNIDGQYSAQVSCGTTRPTNVISTSYGFNEVDLGVKYVQRQCAEYMKLALQGVTIVYSSGDFGVAGNGGQCLAADGQTPTNGRSGMFNPSFPGGCPWVTSVGATQVRNGSTVRAAESACEQVIFSGGGFSNVFAMPNYQKRAVASYYATSAPQYGANIYNNSRVVRGFPDVAANGANFVTAVNGKFTLSYGTSASAPVFAAMITMINEKRIQQGKGPVGFLNSALYANPGVMNDITLGKNPGCGTQGFAAVEGWDPLTGLGTPNYPQMQALFMSLP